MSFGLSVSGEPVYQLTFDGKDVILPSGLGFELTDGKDLRHGFSRTGSETGAIDETWAPVLGEEDSIRIYLEAEPGEYIITARHPKLSSLSGSAKDFAGAGRDVWYVGGVNGENAYETTLKLDFLKPGLTYEATLYADAPEAEYETAPQAYVISVFEANSETQIPIRMARSGGFALSLRER